MLRRYRRVLVFLFVFAAFDPTYLVNVLTIFQICVESSTTHGVLEYSTRVCTRLNILIA